MNKWKKYFLLRSFYSNHIAAIPFTPFYDTRLSDALTDRIEAVAVKIFKGEDTLPAVINLEFYFTFWRETLLENAGTLPFILLVWMVI